MGGKGTKRGLGRRMEREERGLEGNWRNWTGGGFRRRLGGGRSEARARARYAVLSADGDSCDDRCVCTIRDSLSYYR